LKQQPNQPIMKNQITGKEVNNTLRELSIDVWDGSHIPERNKKCAELATDYEDWTSDQRIAERATNILPNFDHGDDASERFFAIVEALQSKVEEKIDFYMPEGWHFETNR